MRWVLYALTLATACNTPPGPTKRSPASAPAASTSASAAPVSALAAPAAADAALGPEPPDGCLAGEVVDAGAAKLLERLGERCVAGMAVLFEKPRRVHVAAGSATEVPLPASDAERCVRVAAVAEAGLRGVQLELVGAGDQGVQSKPSRTRFALLDHEGPVCLGPARKPRLLVRVERGSGDVLVQLWQTE